MVQFVCNLNEPFACMSMKKCFGYKFQLSDFLKYVFRNSLVLKHIVNPVMVFSGVTTVTCSQSKLTPECGLQDFWLQRKYSFYMQYLLSSSNA